MISNIFNGAFYVQKNKGFSKYNLGSFAYIRMILDTIHCGVGSQRDFFCGSGSEFMHYLSDRFFPETNEGKFTNLPCFPFMSSFLHNILLVI